MYDGNETTRFVTGNKAGNLYGTFNKYAWEIENQPRYVNHEAASSGSGFTFLILLALIIGIGYGVFKFTMWFFVYDETAAAVSSVSTVAAHDFFAQRSSTGIINGTFCVIWNWIRIYPMRFTVVVMALIALRNHYRARKYKRMWEQIVDL
jgi:hypothetical protein